MKNLTYDIPLLLCKKATQSITSEEEEILQKWVNENEENRKAYEEFMDKDFLEKELATALDIDTEAPRKAMEKRIKAMRYRPTSLERTVTLFSINSVNLSENMV